MLWYWPRSGPRAGRRRSILSGCAAAASVRSRTTTPATAPGRGTSSSCGTAAGRSCGVRPLLPAGRLGDAPGDEAGVRPLRARQELGPVGRVALEGVLRSSSSSPSPRVPGRGRWERRCRAGRRGRRRDALGHARNRSGGRCDRAGSRGRFGPPGARPSRRRGDPVRRAVRPGGERDQGQPRRSARLVLLRERHRARRRRGRGRAQRGRRAWWDYRDWSRRMAAPSSSVRFRSRSCTAGTESGGRPKSTRRQASTPRRTRCYVCSAAPAARGSRMFPARGRA